MKAIADTGLIVAFGNRHHRFHSWAVEVAKSITEPLLTCEPVLAEAGFQLHSASYVLSPVEDGMLEVAFELTKHRERLAQLAQRYRDRRPDLADLYLICMSEIFVHHAVITADAADFRIYRRNNRQAILILCPPGAPSLLDTH